MNKAQKFAPFLLLYSMQKLLLLYATVFIITTVSAIAQPYFDIGNISGQQSKPFDAVKKNKEYLSFTSFLNALNIPVNLKNENKLLISPSFELHQYDFAASDAEVYNAALPLTFLNQWKNKKWKTAFVFIPRINKSKYYSLAGDAFQPGGAILNTFTLKENLKLKFGLYYNSEFFGNYYLPLAGIDWNINKKLNLFGVLPNALTLEWKNAKDFHTGISFRGITASYRMGTNTWLKVEDNYVKVFVDYYFVPRHVLFCEAGHSVLRKFTSGISTQIIDLEVAQGWLIRAGYAFRIRLDDK